MLEDLGRIEASTGGPVTGGFQVHFSMRGARLDRLRQRIEWLRNKANGEDSEHRRHARYEPAERISQIALPDGRIYACEVLDISVSGAAIKTDVVPGVGTHLMLGKMRGRVVRYIDQGIAVEFLKQIESSKVSTLNPV
jgi:PilZ domain